MVVPRPANAETKIEHNGLRDYESVEFWSFRSASFNGIDTEVLRGDNTNPR